MSLPRNLEEWEADDVALDIEDKIEMTLGDLFGPSDGLEYTPERADGSSFILKVTSTKAPDGPVKRFRISVRELP